MPKTENGVGFSEATDIKQEHFKTMVYFKPNLTVRPKELPC